MSLKINLATKTPSEPFVDEAYHLLCLHAPAHKEEARAYSSSNGLRMLYCIWRLLCAGFDLRTSFVRSKNFSVWMQIYDTFPLLRICSFLFLDLCGSPALTNALVDSFCGMCTLREELPPYHALKTFFSVVGSSVRPGKIHAYARMWVFEPGGKHSVHYIIEEYLALTCAMSYYVQHTNPTPNLFPPSWMIDILIRLHGFVEMMRRWRSCFPAVGLPNVPAIWLSVCRKVEVPVMTQAIDIMATSLLPITYMRYTAGRHWYGNLVPHIQFPALNAKSAPFRAALYAYCKYLGRKHRPHTTRSIYSYFVMQTRCNWELVNIDPSFQHIHDLLADIDLTENPDHPVWLLAHIFRDIDNVVRYHSINANLYKNTNMWRNHLGIVSLSPRTIEAMREDLKVNGLCNDFDLTRLYRDGAWSALWFDMGDKTTTGLTTVSHVPRVFSKRSTNFLDDRSCLDIHTTLMLLFQKSVPMWGDAKYRLIPFSANSGYLVIDRTAWDHTLRGLQWAISVTPSCGFVQRCPAYMSIVNMLLHPNANVGRWALASIMCMISGINPTSQVSGLQFLPTGEIEVNRVTSFLFNILARCRRVYSSTPEMIRRCMCEDDTSLRAIWSMLQSKKKKRIINFHAYLALRNYLLADDNSYRIAAMLDRPTVPYRELDEHLRLKEPFQLLRDELLVKPIPAEVGPIGVDKFADALYMICTNTRYIRDDKVAVEVFSGISVRFKETNKPIPRDITMWNSMVSIASTNLLFNYYEHHPDAPIVTLADNIHAPVAMKDKNAPYSVINEARFDGAKLLSEFVYYLEHDGYMAFPGDAHRPFKRARVEKKIAVNGCSKAFVLEDGRDENSMMTLIDDDDDEGDEGGEEDKISTSSSAKKRKVATPDIRIARFSERSRSDTYEMDVSKTATEKTTRDKMDLGKGIPLFPYVDPESYTDVAYHMPLGIDSRGKIVYETQGLLIPTLPLRLAPEEVVGLRADCVVGPLAGVSRGFLYTLLCDDFALPEQGGSSVQ